MTVSVESRKFKLTLCKMFTKVLDVETKKGDTALFSMLPSNCNHYLHVCDVKQSKICFIYIFEMTNVYDQKCVLVFHFDSLNQFL